MKPIHIIINHYIPIIVSSLTMIKPFEKPAVFWGFSDVFSYGFTYGFPLLTSDGPIYGSPWGTTDSTGKP